MKIPPRKAVPPPGEGPAQLRLGAADAPPAARAGAPPRDLLAPGRSEGLEALDPRLLPVPRTRQSTNHSCGPAALQAVLAYWGCEAREDKLAERLGTREDVGTPPREMLRVAREFGLQADLHEGLTLEQVSRWLGEGVPVLVCAQAWRDDAGRPWSEEWDSGHYMVIIGMDEKNVYFEDPSLLGSRGFLARAEFEDRWHDRDGEGRVYDRCGLVVRGPRPAPPPRWIHID